MNNTKTLITFYSKSCFFTVVLEPIGKRKKAIVLEQYEGEYMMTGFSFFNYFKAMMKVRNPVSPLNCLSFMEHIIPVKELSTCDQL